MDDLRLLPHGAELRRNAIEGDIGALLTIVEEGGAPRVGTRLHGIAALRPFVQSGGSIGRAAAVALGDTAFPVRAVLFDKTAERNWPLSWHQDRTVAVEHHVETAGFGPWTIKRGIVHVAPPYMVLARMVTVRAHLDPARLSNAPLLIAPGSHRLGVIAERDVPDVVARCGTVACEAEAGDVWLYATPILHASAPAKNPSRRRVLQVDYAAHPLPGELRWLGV